MDTEIVKWVPFKCTSFNSDKEFYPISQITVNIKNTALGSRKL